MTRIITGLGEVAGAYDALFCDIWGVVHNGHALFSGVAEALAAFRDRGGVVVLVSNAPRPAGSVAPQLDRLGLPRRAWDAIVTSGDVARSHVAAQAGKALFHLGPERDRPLFEGHDIRFAGEEAAEVIVCTGLFDDTVETPETYLPMLRRFLARGVPMICANPDLVVERGGTMIYCAGAIADAYETLGGPVVTCGKPHRPIYDAGFAVVETALGRRVEPGRVLAIGDSVRTDLAGAAAIGCGALFVTGGIHALEAGHGAALDEAALRTFLAEQGVAPDWAMPHLVW
ncbi:TIGR01459 family HAD-type hydrolase [Labrys wisconsinensis]|uniref:HAD superfamily hydrolase (TIGR01459 family) n=1 Tax=Labrys wisconsinensis TaxID=425677 RepID=A0ABU0JNU6_9HYPH|nr:TIGR01459 family HAD-type hydrolase [Labrys wisconsinensis]MDQ0474959.1 HAD superfamily hydrolase (TIGR01459 family) [Labrys wisconsinensis]